ncbi:ABC transporter substrate-binding protein [Frankia sp. R82]|uniref:ABC transporter substrate-binding protein n=1 Tax=Frankia sp. R82 TaxID=2950553 RepID=UPI0020434027|nr:ABC transporter substrate-binding protein [Frankia sp. R82]MCM3885583.1 ABC transporter substrate-binding protein [Frankia sp. R82]
MRVRSLSALSAAVLFLAPVAGCHSSSATSASACNDPGVSKNEVRVGLIYPDSGALARTFQPMRSGLNARLGVVNESGGVNSRQVHYTWADDRGRVDTNAVVSRSIVEKDQAFAVIEATAASSGGAGYLAAENIPVVGVGVEAAWSQYRNMFTYALSSSATPAADVVTTLGKYARVQGGSRALVVGDPTGLGVSDNITEQMRASFASVGIPVLSANADESPTNGQINEIIRLIGTERVDILASTLTTETFARIVAAVRQAGAPLKVILGNNQPPNEALLTQYGPLLAGLTTYVIVSPASTSPAAAAYRAAAARFAPELGDSRDVLAEVGYLLGDMIIRGLEAAGPCPTRQSFITGLRAVKNYTAGGLVPSVDFEKDFGRTPVCYPFAAVNATGTGLTIVSPDFCGERIAH